MPNPRKACDGSFSDETVDLLIKNQNRAQWLPHACAVCGQEVAAHQHMGRWVPDAHWPSIPPRPSGGRQVGRHSRSGKATLTVPL